MCASKERSAWSNSIASDDVAALRRRFVEEGVWIRPFGNIVYLTPPFTIGADELAMLTRAIYRVLAD